MALRPCHQPSIRPKNFGHDSSMRTSSRRRRCESGKRFLSFSEARRAVFCTVRAGCESAHSRFRSEASVDPGHRRGGSRCARSLDSQLGCAASSRVIRLACGPLPLWLRHWSCGGSGVDTAYEIPRPGALSSAPLPPVSGAESDSPLWRSPPAAAVRQSCARAESVR